ncbi:hypothetical protein GIS00_01755 [Nakamurella sp. YIM 132087]|uniref:CdiI immunity protein domain-containing protein n=1 Tax=Nakamurella alba TaxID=2665158 RepID=A0A7K1FF11_9ACTN|nr:contact-dependent growth inhibition system immunity protein [Nakamurella alba]MTD12670.1 hypothetical protein [Nakamurella alba]
MGTYYRIQHLLNVYYDEDWPLIAGDDTWQPIKEFLKSGTTAKVELIEQLDLLLRFDDQTITRILEDQMDAEVHPADFGYTYAEWAREVRDRVRADLAQEPPPAAT